MLINLLSLLLALRNHGPCQSHMGPEFSPCWFHYHWSPTTSCFLGDTVYLPPHPGRERVHHCPGSGRFETVHTHVLLHQRPVLLGTLVCQRHSAHAASHLASRAFTHLTHRVPRPALRLPFTGHDWVLPVGRHGTGPLPCHLSPPPLPCSHEQTGTVTAGRGHLGGWLLSCTCTSKPHSHSALLFKRGGSLLLWPGTTNEVGVCGHKVA